MADKVTSLYNALKADGLFKQARSLNDFKAKMAYQGYRSQIYKLARDKGANVGTFSQFTNALGYSSGSPKPKQSYGGYQPQQQNPEKNTAMTTAQRAMQVPYRQNAQLGKTPKSAPKNASPFVQSLYEIDDAQKGADYPVDYTSPKATQKVYRQNQQVRRQAAKTAARKMDRQASHAQPIMQTNTPADTYIGKTEGQLMDEMNQSANALVGSEMGDYLDKVIGDEFKAAHARGLAVLSANSGVHGTAGADWWIGERAYQSQMDQDKQLQEITGNIQKNIESIFSDPKVKQRVLSDAQRLGVSPEAYIESSLAPALIEKAGEQFNKTQLNRMMAKGASDYIASGILNSLTGTLLTGLTSTKSQRQMQQQADAMTEEGLNPNYKPGTLAKAAKGAVAFAADAPWYNLTGYGAGALTEKVFGNTAQQMARMANQSLRQRVFEGVARGVVHGGATGFQYGFINGAVQNYSTGEDTSLWGTLKAAAKGGLEESVSFATMEGMGGAVGAFGHGIGLKGTEKTWKQRVNKMGQKLTYEGIKTGMEGIGMATGGVASSYANHVLTGDDWHGFSTEGTLESCASAVIFKLTHAKDLFKKETDRNGKPFSFTSNIAQKTARFFLSGEAKSAPHVFSDEEKHQLFAAGSELGMKPMENIISWAKQAKKYRAEDIEKSEDGSDLLNNYQQIMLDPNVSWDAKAKFTTMVMGTMPESRPMMDHISYGTEEGTDGDNRIHTYKTINEYASDGTLLSKHRFDTKDKRESIVYEIGVRKEELRSKNALALLVGLDRNNYDLQNSFFKENAKDWEQVQGIVEGMQTGGSKIDHQFTEYVLNSERGSFLPIVDAVANKNGMDREGMLKAFDKDPMKRTDEEQNACVQLRKAIEMEVFPANKVHEEQSAMDGKDVATDNSLGTEQPNGEAVKAELNGLKQAEDEMDVLIRDNDVFGQNFQKLKQQGLTNPQIYDWMVQQGGLTVEQLEPFAHYINANARVQGMQEATKNAIDEQVSSYVQDWSFHGTLNGQEAKGEQAIFVQDRDGRTLILGSGEVAFDSTTGRAKEGVGDMIVCLDPNTHDVVYLKSDEVTLFQNQPIDQFAAEYTQRLQMKNSEPYNQAAQEQAIQDAAKPQQEEKVPQDNTTKSEVNTTSGKDNTTSEDLVPQEQPQSTRKFADGSDVPMATDSKGRPTPDYGKMTPEQSAEILTEDFGENADKVVDGQIQKAEKALKDAEKMKVDYTAEPNDIMEQEALKTKTIEAAKKQLEHAQNIKKTMTARKVAETVGNTEEVEGAHEAGNVAAQKFANAPRLVGNKRTRMLPDGETKIKGHYEIVPAESLTPSHDVNNGYKKSEGFPTDAEGRTVNDRDYEHDKAAQHNTDQIAMKYNGMAIENVPVVSDEGIVYDGNGRTMAGQKAAKEGTDGEYINDLLENAENFGFTREQIEQSGIEHPRLVMVTDERLPYDAATFAKFNRNEKKTQSNTEQAVAKAKTLTSDEVGAIVAEIEGNGSLDAFFNNSKAINDLVKTLVDKGIIGQNEVAQMMDSPERLSAQGREYVKNLLLGSIFKPETIRMLGIDSAVKNKAINAIRSVMDNMKLGEFSLRDEIDQAIQLLYEARQGGNKVDTLLRTPDMFGEDAAKRYPSISQMMALALEGKVADFRDLLDEYNRIAASRNTGEGNMFEAAPTKEELINEYLNFKKWQDYGTGHSENEGGNDVSGTEKPQQETSGGNEPAEAGEGSESEPAVKVNKALKKIATEITKQTGIEVVTDEKEAQRALEDADSDVKYSREAGGAVLDWGNVPSKARISNDELTTIIMRNNREYIDELDKLGEGEFIEHYVDANGYFYTFRVDKNHHIYMDEAIPKTSSANRERINELKVYYDGERARYSEEVRSNRSESQSELGRSEDSYRSTIGTGNSENSAMGGRIGESDSKGNVERDTSHPEQSGSALKEFRSAKGEVYGFTVGGKIYLDTKKMKPETPLHEYTHLWTEALRNTNPEEWENVKGLFDGVDGLKGEVQKLYPELKGDALYEEMISTFSGREGAKKLEETVRNLAQQEGKSVEESAKATGFLGKVKEALQRYWKGVADMLHIHFTSAEDVADKVLEDWAKGANPKDYKAKEEPVETKREEAKTEKSKDWTDEEIDKLSSVESKWQEKVDDYISENYPAHNGVRSRTTEEQAKYDAETEAMKEDATLAKMRKDADAEYKATEEEIRNSHLPKDPMEGIKQAAGAFHEEQKQKGEFVMNLKLGKARQEYAEAKEHGDASEIKRTRDELKQRLDERYKAQHMGLVQRRKEIAKEIGMPEAKKIDKPFSEMDSEEREYVANQNPLTESEIREQTSEENKNFIEDAVDYINGNHGFAQKMAYLKIYDDVRNRHENVSDNSGAENGTQLDAANTTGGEKLGLGRGRESGGSDGPVDRGTGNEAAPGEPERREGDQNDSTLSVGKSGDKQGEGSSSDMGAVPAGNTDTKGSGTTGKDGNVSEQGGRGGSNRPAKPDAKRKPAAKQGTTWRGRTGEEIKKNVADKKSAALAAIAELKKRKFGKGGSGHLGSFELLTPDQMEYVPTLMNAVKEYGMAIIDEGIYKVKDWFNHIRETFAGGLKDCGFTDQDIDDFIKEMWNSKMTMDGETHTIAEWCSIYGNQKLREKLGEELDVKYQKQMDAEPIEVKIGDRKNIEETLPFLLPQQQDDVLKAETQFFGKDHTDREHAYGKGYMFTNGTGTGKTYTGLGIAKRLAKQGKGRILFVTPSQKKVNDWMKDGKNLGLDIRDLDSVAKEKGTTATTESGDGMVITTFANFGLNKKLLETEWDAVIYDECHRIMENKKGAETARSMQHYMMTNRDENHCFLRLQTINPHYQKMQNAADRFNELRRKEVQRIQKEYKQSHPSATAKDVINATFSQLPKELNSFALADATAFPKLGKAYQDFTSAKQHYYNNVEPKLKEQAKNTWKNTKTIFLSATPFNTRENLDYAEGYIFKFPEDDGSRMSGRSRFYLDHFGAAYRYRYNRLEAKTDNPAAVAKQEVAFSDYLQDTLGTMSGRIIDSAYDYSRDFPTVAPDHADEFNNAVEEAVKGRYLGEAYSRTIGDYNYGSALFETMKVANIIQRMKDHLAAGRKIVVFHRRVETKNPIQPPFAYMLDYANRMIAEMKPGKERNEAIKECTEFRNKYADLLDWEQTLDYSMPREQIAKVFGRDNVLFFSGKESKKVKDKAVDTFNDDNSGKNIIVIQEASGKEGISLHDVTGNHQRVLITLGLPQSPITALQIEGRTYRIGNKSNAIFEYPILGLNSEMMLFGQKFNNQVSTTENLALGSQARNLRDSFANGILEHSGIVPIDQQGVGGKEFDAPKQSDSDPFDDAVLDYYSNQKLNKNNREGVDYFPTPEPLGYKMVEWANMGEGDTALEPSAGHGAIARYVPKNNELLSIEPSQSLFAKLQLKAGGLGRKFLNNTFENYNVANKHDVVVMNPPFGTAGATAIAHLDKAFRHLDEGGRVVAIIPRGSTDKKFDKWYGEQKNVAMRAEVDLPDIVFQQAGTNVRCRVVVLDKITDNALRSKAGYPEKIDLSGNYDKIEDFFEDLRDVQMPDRIIDTQMKSMKKARTFKKDIEDIKGMTVTIEKNGISVFDKNAYRDYSISFPSIKHNEEWTKENYSKVYERFDQEQNRVYSENSKAALDEMKKLACKLAGMSEEEMQKYISDKKNVGTHFRESRGLQYSKSDAKDVKNSRIIPEDVDKNVSSQIEKKFDDEVNSAKKELGITDGSFDKLIEDKVSLYADLPESEIIKDLEYDSNKTSQSGVLGQENPKLHNERSRRAEHQAARIAAKRELDYRKDRKSVLGNDYGLRQGDVLSPIQIEKCFKTILAKQGKSEEIERLFNKAIDICKRIGLRFNVLGESKNGSLGYSTTDREVGFNIDDLTKTRISSKELPVTILHEILHQMTLGSIDLVKRGKADGILTPKQIEAVNSILDIYNKVKDNRKQFEENTYGLTDEYEFAAQMADPRQRKALDLDIWDRIKNAAKELANKGDRSLWQTFKDAIKRLFEISDKDKMDEALNTIMGDFNETLDDIALNDIEENGFAYKLDNEEDRKLFDSLNNKRNTRKEYNDTVTELARRMAEGDRSISERTTGGMEETEKSISSGREDWRGASMGRSYAGFNIRPKSIAHCAADIIANDVSRRIGTQNLSSTRKGLELGQKGSLEDSATDTIREISSWELTDQRVASVGEREVSSRIENWAKQNNAWFDWRTLRGRFDRNERLGTGDEAESDVFLSKDGKSVLKIVRNPHAIYDTLQGKLDSIALHNELFPTDAMNVIGFTKVNEDGFPITSVLLEQPYIKGKTVYDSFSTFEEKIKFTDKFMKSLGFTKEKWAAKSGFFEGVPDDIWRKGDYAVEDVNAGNIIIDKNGKGHIIDCVVSKYEDAVRGKNVYDSTEEKKQIQAENKAIVERLRREIKNQELRLEALQEARNENNKYKIDEFIDDVKNKITGFEKQIKEKQNAIHFREEENDSPVKISNEAPVVVKHIAEVAKKVGAKVQMVSSVDEITNKAAKAAIEEGRKITGWYDEKTGEVHLYMPNIHDRYTAEKTIWHETVGHKGMRGLMGESFDKFLDSVWYDLDKPGNADLKKLVTEEMKYSPLDYRNAIEEGIARMAEEGKGEPGFWNTIKNKVSDFFHELGYRMYPNTKDVKYLLWLSKNLQKNPNDPYWKMRAEAVRYRLSHEDVRSVVERNGMYFDNDGKNHDYLIDLNHKDFEEATDGKVHFRTSPTTASKIEEYNRRLATKLYAFKESTVDHMQSLQEAMEVISGEKDVWNNIPSSFNPLLAQNSMDSKVQQLSESYDRKITKPLDESFQKVVSLIDGKNKDEQLRNAQLYMITKHGLERNRVFFVRDTIRGMEKDDKSKATSLQTEWTKKHKDLSDDLEKGKIRFDEYLNQMDEWIRSNVDLSYVADEHDYSGFHGMQKKDINEKYDDKLAIDNVMSVESKLGGSLVKDFWSKKKAATDYIIDQQYTSGFADEVERDYLKGMFQWYVPLRKFDDTTAEDVYGYLTEKGDVTNYVGPTLANAKGRSSLSDVNVLAQISAMAKTSIINGGKNVVKQHLARFISAYENGETKNRIFVEINPWVEKHTIDGNEVWEEVTPQIPKDATQEQISDILQGFENNMKAKQASGEAKLLRNKADIGFKFQRAKDKSEHIVEVYIAGKKKSFVCQGNPRAAQAINGLLVDSGTRNKASEIDAKITRKLAQFNTSLNPDFMSSNMLRDLTSASANVTKEGFGYTKDFLKAYAGNMRSIMNLSGRGNYLTMFRRYREDKLDMNNERDRMFKEFMDNGGQTGFVQIKKFEDLTKEYDNLIKKGNKDADRWLVKKIKKGLSFIEAANEIVEGIARYSTYCTSRKHGRSIGKSIYDAKEVSSNFNRHGSGDAIKTLKTEYDSKYDKKFRSTIGFFNSWMKNHTQFYNAGVQGANLLFKNYKSAAITTAISFGFMPFCLGIAQALINQCLISREDEKDRNGVKDPYAELPEWKRRNNICIYWGHGEFKTIPLGIELRASFGIGDIAAGYVVNENLKSDTPIGYDILGQVAQLVPASDFLGHHSPSSSIKEVGEDVLLGVTPTTIKPFGELIANRDWTGRPFYRDKDYLDKAPRWKSAYDNTSDIYMTINKWANQSTNGIDASNPDMKGNETLDYLTAPYGWQHVIDSYTGGMGSTIRRAYDTGSAAIKGVVSGAKSEEGFGEGFSKEWSKLDKNQIPLYRVFNYTPSEGNNMQRTKSKWYNYTDEFAQIEYNLRQMRTDTPDLVKNFENHSKLYKFTHGDEGKAFNIWKAADDYIYNKRRDLKKTNDPVVKKSIEEQINIKMQEAVNDLDSLQ